MFAPTTTTTTPQARNREPIPKRKMEFDLMSVETPFWFDGNGLVTAILSALSASVPPGREEVVLGIAKPEVMADLGHGVMDDAMVEAAAYVLEKA